MSRPRKNCKTTNRSNLRMNVERLEQRNLFASLASGDFNGDGFDDTAAGVVYESFGAVVEGGAINVINGSASGLVATGNQFWNQNSPGIVGNANSFERFGFAIATGDFNNDGRDDIAVGIPNDLVGVTSDAGSVQVFYGSSTGLTATGNQLWNQNSPSIPGVSGASDNFGYSLATGDFDGDGFADLAIGAPGDGIGAVLRAGSVTVLRGSATGLSSSGVQFWSQNSAGIIGVSQDFDVFGSSLIAGDFNQDGKDDLAIGVPGDWVGVIRAGTVNVLFGSATGLASPGNQIWSQNSAGIADVAEDFDAFGTELASGDFDGDLFDDLAIGVPSEGLGVFGSAGAVHIIRGGATGLQATSSRFLTQETPGIPDSSENSDLFGQNLSTADFNADGFDDLAIGVASENVGLLDSAGAVTIVYGSLTGATGSNSQQWTQNSSGILDVAEAFDLFGYINTGDFNGDGRTDIMIAAPNESVGAAQGAGSMHILFGSNTGLTSLGNQVWNQNSPGILDVAEAGDSFPAIFASFASVEFDNWIRKRPRI